MARSKKTEAAAPEAVQAGQEPQELTQDTQESEAVSEAPEAVQDGAAQEIVGPEDESALLGCQEVLAGNPSEEPGVVVFTEYAVVGCERLNLREEPRLDAPVVAELPCGVGVAGNDSPAQDGWRQVFTGRLFGWVMDKYLEPIILSHAAE